MHTYLKYPDYSSLKINKELIKNIKIAVFDFDGVFTDNRVYVNEKGEESVVCSRFDGIGLSALSELGIQLLILSKEVNNVVNKRAEKLKIECIHGCDDKFKMLDTIIRGRDIAWDEVAYTGNDTNDVECLEYAGFPIVVADAHNDLIEMADYITLTRGGYGAVREICDLIMHYRK